MTIYEELWAEIPGYEGLYQASDLGRIRRMARVIIAPYGGVADLPAKVRVFYQGKDGRNRLQLCKDGKTKGFYVAVLVMLSFVGPKPKGQHVCHNNGVRTDDRLSNLRYDTPEANQADRVKHGTDHKGSQVTGAKLTEADIPGIRAALRSGEAQLSIAHRYGLKSNTSICGINQGKLWSHVP